MIHEKRTVKKEDVDKMMQFVLMLRENGTYIAYCPVLDESSEGETPEDAQRNLREAIKLRLQDKNLPYPKVDVVGVMTHSLFISSRGVRNSKNKANVLT